MIRFNIGKAASCDIRKDKVFGRHWDKKRLAKSGILKFPSISPPRNTTTTAL